MNGFSSRGMNGYDGGRPPMLRPAGSSSSAMDVGYRQEDMSNDPRDRPRYSPMTPIKAQNPVRVDLQDPIQVHLLTETALLDSKGYQILSQEEVDDVKKEIQVLSQRIEQTRSTLAIQSKYRDAAISMARLYSPTAGKRRSLLGNRNSGGGDAAAREAESEREAIERKCEMLSSELFALEKRIMEPQRRLLEHTAGILQLTHKSAKSGNALPASAPLVNGVPASPESMYTRSTGRNSMDPGDVPSLFDDGDMLRYFDDVGGFTSGRPRKNSIEIPMKSPVREQNKQLVEETEKLREEKGILNGEKVKLLEENNMLKREADSLKTETQTLSFELDDLRNQSANQWKMISDTERKLDLFNSQLRGVIVNADPAKNGNYATPPSGQLESGDILGSHLDYLEKAVAAVGEIRGGNPEAEKAIQALNLQVQDVLLLNGDPSHPPPPDANAEFDDQVRYMQDSLRAVEAAVQRAASLSSASFAEKQRGEQAETVLMGLWEIIQSGYADIRQRNQERRKTRIENGLEAEDEDMSDTEAFDTNEKFSLSAFSTRVQWLYAQATKLKDQKVVLKRQIKQQRELNNKSDGEKDETLKAKEAELGETRNILARLEKEAGDVRVQLATALADLETAQTTAAKSGQQQSVAIREAQDQLKERNAKVASLEASAQDVQTRLSKAEASIATITAQLKEANEAKSAADKAVEAKTKEVKDTQEELDQMTSMMAEFKMEATLAKAELDGAYGTRRERAAEVAALANTSETTKLQAKVDELQPRVDELEKELRATVSDLKTITKQAIDAESKIADLESELDNVTMTARRDKEQIQEELDAERLKASNGPMSPSGRPNASILTDSYRDALRAERKKYDEQLRNEQMNRRKLEDELRALKRAAGPGKSPLSPR